MLTNPTHFAVALRYRPGEDAAPVVLAKGRGATAEAIRELAGEHEVPMLSYPQLTRALYYTSRPGQIIREDLYMAVATVLAFVFNLDAALGAPARRRGAARHALRRARPAGGLTGADRRRYSHHGRGSAHRQTKGLRLTLDEIERLLAIASARRRAGRALGRTARRRASRRACRARPRTAPRWPAGCARTLAFAGCAGPSRPARDQSAEKLISRR